MVYWQDARRLILKNQPCVWEPSLPHSHHGSVMFFCFFLSGPLFMVAAVEAVCLH